MRPIRLFLSGYTAFTDEVEIDFTGTELFAFTGPTGAGKSSLVDAMVFALYGSVPRLDRKAVAPIVSVRRTEARVSFTFSVGVETYTAVRVVRRTKTGASTREARLERGDGAVLAGNERELTVEVERLLGLGFEQFTKCVVLPQNEFMRLLHEEPSKRQDLLISLLGLSLYERMARLARERERLAVQMGDVSRTLLDKVAFATPEALAETAQRIEGLVSLRAEVDAAKPVLEGFAARIEQVAAQGVRERAATDLLVTVVEPDGLAGRSSALRRAHGALAAAEGEVERLVANADAAESALLLLPARSSLEAAERAHAARAELMAQQGKGEALLTTLSPAVSRAAVALAEAQELAVQAGAHLERALWEHRAADLASSLVSGEPCPVCEQMVVDVPVTDRATAVDEARHRKREAEAALAAARRASEEAVRKEGEVRLKIESISERLTAQTPLLAQHPDAATVEETLGRVEAAEQAERGARSAASSAQRTVIASRRSLQALEADDLADQRCFDETRDRVAALGAPSASRNDLVADWKSLAAWSAEQVKARQAAAVDADRVATSLAADRERLLGQFMASSADIGVTVLGDDLRAGVGDALARANSEHARVGEAMVEAVGHRDDLARHAEQAEVARQVARLLRADNFEKWVLDEALAALVVGASGVLLELSDNAYSLGLDERSNFSVVDHRNADEVRSARTLSGGETFLASLALALALADQIGSLAAEGAPRLESIFLDEGFGTLDPDTLDTVAAAIEELSARGRMVGLVSHVGELAERVPVRFEVSRGLSGSTVKKVST